MLQQIQKYYEGSNLSGAVSSVINIEIGESCTLKEVRVSGGANVSGADCEFELKKNGTAITGADVTVEVGTKKGEATGLLVALAEDDELDLGLVSGALNSPIVLTLTVETETPVSQSDVYEAVKAVIAAGSNVTVTEDDLAKTVTIASTASLTDEQIQDMIATFLQQGSNVTLTYDDTSNQLTIAASGGGGSSEIEQNSQSANYTLVLGDAQKHILHPSSDNNARTFTIPANSSVAFPVGTTITFVNRINTVTIAITTDTLRLAGTSSTGSRSLAVNGMATALKIGSTEWIISGPGLT